MKKLYTVLSVFAIALSANAQNLVPNGGFETWTVATTPDSWTITVPTNGGSATRETTAANVHGGTSSLKVVAPAGTGNVRVGVTDFAVVAGHSYTLTYWYKDGSDNAKGRHWGAWRTSSAAITDNSLQPDYYPNSTGGDWQLVTVTATAPATATVLRFDFRVYQEATGADSGTIYYDDVMIVDNTLGVKENNIAGLKVYPNPVTNGKFFITSDTNVEKTVAIYDVLGKQVVNTTATESVNVSNLKGGVYIVKITEEGKTATRKLVIK
ncbi:T9SS type A sorting domain-containing protein [Flavobacterium lindanitolerans]|jgi:hypothetical protein|uniref:T9SS type A sorting domain-containing protein n=1 Tax=Flavobacterium lindanitolerans TaxID=428988 RepID=UPI0023F2D44D|nr:T9SS type A sorting domain-containing protein [Flavobacterium lindanitolerans]